MIEVCNHIKAPIKPEKVVQPTTQITFFGIQIDTVTMTASITKECKSSILDELQSFRTSKTCKRTKRQVLSVIGKLSFVCKVVPAGRILLHRLIDLSMSNTYTTDYQSHWKPSEALSGGKISFPAGLALHLS